MREWVTYIPKEVTGLINTAGLMLVLASCIPQEATSQAQSATAYPQNEIPALVVGGLSTTFIDGVETMVELQEPSSAVPPMLSPEEIAQEQAESGHIEETMQYIQGELPQSPLPTPESVTTITSPSP